MKRLSIFLLLTSSIVCLAQAPPITSGSKVYIEPAAGYEAYLAAAMLKRHVPIVVVTDKAKADYILTSTVSHVSQNQPAVVVNNHVSAGNHSGRNDAFDRGFQSASTASAARRALDGQTSVSVSIVDPKSSQVVFAYSAGSARADQLQSTAEACAKHLKQFIEKRK